MIDRASIRQSPEEAALSRGDRHRSPLVWDDPLLDHPGLRQRIRRASDQIRGQHLQIAPIFQQLQVTVASGSLRDSQTLAFRLQGAIQAHFLLEQEIVFPLVLATCPNLSDDLTGLLEDHGVLDSSFRKSVDLIVAAARRSATQALDEFVSRFRTHENREEAVLALAVGDRLE